MKKTIMIMAITAICAISLCSAASAADNGTWYNETVANSGDVGEYNSIAVDSSGNPHISYLNNTNGTNITLNYAYKDGSTWKTETLTGGLSFDTTSIALDSAGNPHISFTQYNYGHPNIGYAYFDGTTWHIETAIAGGGGGCLQSDLALDSTGVPHISYAYLYGDSSNLNVTLKHAYNPGSGWVSEDVETLYYGPSGSAPDDLMLFPSIATDSSNYPRISYYDIVNKDLKYAYKNGSGWHTTSVDGGTSDVGKSTSLALDSSGNPHISYFDETNNALKYASFSGVLWNIETITGTGKNLYDSLALDKNNVPHISFSGPPSTLYYATWTGSSWNIETVDNGGKFNSLALDAAGNPNISYSQIPPAELLNSNLKYAHYVPTNNNSSQPSSDSTSNTDPNSNNTKVNAATINTVGMQNTGAPIIPLTVGLITILGGLAATRRK